MTVPNRQSDAPIDWESFYQNYRKPGYLPGFEILHKLGAGAFGIVFKARRESIGKEYAVKFLKVDDANVRDAVLRELERVNYFAQVDHPNLVTIEDRGEVDGIPYILMGYAGDATLATRLREGALPRAAALRLFVQVARGLRALHEHGLVHFDLKPANVFLRGDVARLGDYGLAKLMTTSRNSLSFGRGTPYYMAPEMLRRQGDHRSDIYSLGVMLYECLTGQVPFRGDSEWEVLQQHERDEPQWPPSLAPNEREVIARCLAKRPEDRFQSVDELLTALGTEAAPAATTPPAPASAPTPIAALAAPAPIGGRRQRGARPHRQWNRAWVVAGLLALLFFANKKLFRQAPQFFDSGRSAVAASSAQVAEIARFAYPTGLTTEVLERIEEGVTAVAGDEVCVDDFLAELESEDHPVLVAVVNAFTALDFRRPQDCTVANRLAPLLARFGYPAGALPEPPVGTGRVSASVRRSFEREVERLRRWYVTNYAPAPAMAPASRPARD